MKRLDLLVYLVFLVLIKNFKYSAGVVNSVQDHIVELLVVSVARVRFPRLQRFVPGPLTRTVQVAALLVVIFVEYFDLPYVYLGCRKRGGRLFVEIPNDFPGIFLHEI